MLDDASALKASDVMSDDADMWERINSLVIDKYIFQSVFIHALAGSTLFELQKKKKNTYNQETTLASVLEINHILYRK